MPMQTSEILIIYRDQEQASQGGMAACWPLAAAVALGAAPNMALRSFNTGASSGPAQLI